MIFLNVGRQSRGKLGSTTAPPIACPARWSAAWTAFRAVTRPKSRAAVAA